jgi:hypothetical protein
MTTWLQDLHQLVSGSWPGSRVLNIDTSWLQSFFRFFINFFFPISSFNFWFIRNWSFFLLSFLWGYPKNIGNVARSTCLLELNQIFFVVFFLNWFFFQLILSINIRLFDNSVSLICWIFFQQGYLGITTRSQI